MVGIPPVQDAVEPPARSAPEIPGHGKGAVPGIDHLGSALLPGDPAAEGAVGVDHVRLFRPDDLPEGPDRLPVIGLVGNAVGLNHRDAQIPDHGNQDAVPGQDHPELKSLSVRVGQIVQQVPARAAQGAVGEDVQNSGHRVTSLGQPIRVNRTERASTTQNRSRTR